MLEVSNLMVFFENALALNGLSLEVREGEIVGLIGSNSAGKTTLMNTVSGLIMDMRIKEKRKGGQRISIYGSIRYDGADITETPPSERVTGIAKLLQEPPPCRDAQFLWWAWEASGHRLLVGPMPST